MPALHGRDADIGDLAERAAAFIRERLEGAPLGRTASAAELDTMFGGSITPDGLGVDQAWRLFLDAVVANSIGVDSDAFLAFIPVAPSAAASWMDAMAGVASIPAESWLEASGAVAAENQVLQLLCDLAGMPPGSGGCFMSGGSIGNLSALAVARDQHPNKRVVAVADTAHASVFNTLHLLGMQVLTVRTAEDGRFTAQALREATHERTDIRAVVAAAGSTNAGLIDDLDGLADVAEELGAWFHVDGAYGGAALFLPEFADRLRGMARADSFIVDPHKWLFAPYGSCALIYRRPALAREVHTQHGPYIDVLRVGGDEWNPSDLGFQLTRRASGLPLWFALVLHGTEVFTAAIRAGIDLARHAADALRRVPGVTLVMEPELSIVLFRRHGWGPSEWRSWARRLLDEGTAFVAPTTWRGEAVGRLVFMHPLTSHERIGKIVSSLEG